MDADSSGPGRQRGPGRRRLGPGGPRGPGRSSQCRSRPSVILIALIHQDPGDHRNVVHAQACFSLR